jgi:hypothetical protein
MGFYINEINGKEAPSRLKVGFVLKEVPGAKSINPPTEWQEDLVCVVHNGAFDAAGYAFDENEMNAFLAPDYGSQRPRTWLLVPGAKDLAGYKG